jgi:disulfide bond formation protein DsbB
MIVKIIYTFVFGFLLASFSSFIINQATLFISLRSDYLEQHTHDLFTLHEICLNDDIKNSIGPKYNIICKEIEKSVLLDPNFKALKEVLNRTYLCGSTSCFSYIKDLFGLVFIDWKIILFFGLIVPILTKIISYSSKRKHHEDYFYKLDSQIPFHTLPFDKQYYYSIK